LIAESGLPNETSMAAGLKKGSYWEKIATPNMSMVLQGRALYKQFITSGGQPFLLI